MGKILNRNGFTLVETLVSVLIAALLLGAATIAGRTVSRAAEIGQQQAQMNAIADTQFALFQLMQQADPKFYSTIVNDGSPRGYGQFFDSGYKIPDTTTIDWAPLTNSGYVNMPSPYYIPFSITNNNVLHHDSLYMFGSAGVFEGANSPFGTSIPVTSLVAECQHPDSKAGQYAVCQDSPLGNDNNYFTSSAPGFLQRGPWDGPSNSSVPDLNSDPSWVAYLVSVSLSPIGSTIPFTTYDVPAPVAQTSLQTAGYLATVQVANYHNPTHRLKRTMLLTAWQS